MLVRLRNILFFLLTTLCGVATAQVGSESLPMPDAVPLLALPDSAPTVDTALFSFGDTAQLVNVVTKKERRLELPKAVEATEIDTSGTSRIFRYTLNRATNDVALQAIDTSLFYYRTDFPFFRNDVGAIFLGNLGSPAIYYNYFKRKNDCDFIFQQPYEPYFFTPNNVSFYNTTTPYTVLYYDWSGSKAQMEDQLRVLHTQNIFNRLNFVLEFNNMGTKGQYPRQHIKSRSFNLGLSYLGKYYKANIGYIFNDVEAQESGGIVDDNMITDTLVETQMQTARLRDAKNALNNSHFYLTHSVDLPLIYFGNDSVINNILMARFGHSLEISKYGKLYTDRADTAYFANNYFSSAATRDSLGMSSVDNKIFLQLRPLRAYIFESLAAGIGYKSMNAFMFAPSMYLTGSKSHSLYTAYAYASMSAWYKRYFKWNAFAEANLAGYKIGDRKLGGDMTLSVYPIKGGVHLKAGVLWAGTSPDFFHEKYSTNHYEWTNNFNRDEELRLEAKLSIPALRCELGASQSVHSNFIYFAGEEIGKLGANVLPKQHSEALSITAFTVSQNFEFGGLNFNHRALIQISGNEDVISLPLMSLSASYYYECDLVKRVLRMQLGVDFQYATKFNGYGYNPSVGMFYTSNVKQGGHLWADAFIAFRWKRATPFFKYEHVTQGLIDGNTNYFSAVHYPRNARVWKIGLSWKFFD